MACPVARVASAPNRATPAVSASVPAAACACVTLYRAIASVARNPARVAAAESWSRAVTDLIAAPAIAPPTAAARSAVPLRATSARPSEVVTRVAASTAVVPSAANSSRTFCTGSDAASWTSTRMVTVSPAALVISSWCWSVAYTKGCAEAPAGGGADVSRRRQPSPSGQQVLAAGRLPVLTERAQ